MLTMTSPLPITSVENPFITGQDVLQGGKKVKNHAVIQETTQSREKTEDEVAAKSFPCHATVTVQTGDHRVISQDTNQDTIPDTIQTTTQTKSARRATDTLQTDVGIREVMQIDGSRKTDAVSQSEADRQNTVSEPLSGTAPDVTPDQGEKTLRGQATLRETLETLVEVNQNAAAQTAPARVTAKHSNQDAAQVLSATTAMPLVTRPAIVGTKGQDVEISSDVPTLIGVHSQKEKDAGKSKPRSGD